MFAEKDYAAGALASPSQGLRRTIPPPSGRESVMGHSHGHWCHVAFKPGPIERP